MKKTTLTFYSKLARPLLMVAGLFLSWNLTMAQSNCSLGCNSSIQVSLDNANCEAVITPADLLTDSTKCPGGSFIVELRHNGHLLPHGDTITAEFVGKTLEAKVIDTFSTNSCWGWITVEDKLAPIIDCTSPDDMSCVDAMNFWPDVTENCGTYELFVIDSTVITNNCDGTLDEEVLKQVTKVYKAIDLSGNESDLCTISFNVLKLEDLMEIDGPMSFRFPTNNLLCNQVYDTLANGNPSPEFTGYPTLDTIELKPNGDLPCNLIVNFSDEIIKDKDCIKKILRTWTIIEWSCDSPPPRSIPQMIEIADTNKPIITGQKDILASTTPHHCEALVDVPPVMVFDSCTAVTVTISGGTPLIVGNGGQTMLPVGISTLTYTASDECGNTTTAQIEVTVEDLTPPVPVCDQNTTVSVSTDGQAWVHAKVFDDGSYDECQLAKMLVRRMGDDVCDCEEPMFDDFIELGEYNGHYYVLSKHKIAARLANKHGIALGGYLNIAETTAERTWINNAVSSFNDTLGYLTNISGNVFIDIANGGTAKSVGANSNDKYNYVIELTEKCGWSSFVKFCCADVGNDVMVAFRVVDANCNFNDCMVNAEIQDKLPPLVVCPDDLDLNCETFYETGDLVKDYGAYTAIDNCELIDTSDIITFSNVNQCNVGDLVRTITVTDAGGRTSTCVQEISIEGKAPNSYDIDFPADITMNTCADPESDYFKDLTKTGMPVVNGDTKCTQVGMDYEDKVFTFNNPTGEACFKIIRTWTFIDWCNKTNGSFVIQERDQVIKVIDTVKPVITTDCTEKLTQSTFDGACEDGFIELMAAATDTCTNVLDFYYHIDLDNDGTFDNGTYKGQPLYFAGSGNVADASGTYPIGTHRIKWAFADKCGNVTSCEQIFEIVNMKAPTPYCHNGLAVDLMPVDTDNDGEIDGGMVELWASDFDAGSYHSCPGYNVLVSFTPDVDVKNRTFTCLDTGFTEVMIYASVISPQGDTLQSFCNTYIHVQDNMGACEDDMMRVGVFGNLTTQDNRSVLGAMVELKGTEAALTTTNDEGYYTFGQMPTGGTYSVIPSKDDDHMNGVSTLDLVLIQRHILNIATFDSPYNYIAADVNKDDKVTASDLVELRKMILGVIDSYPNNKSWRFIDSDFAFPQGINPLDTYFEESYDIDLLTGDMKIDFKSVKIGDVNNSSKVNVRDANSENRSGLKLELTANETSFDQGSSVKLSLQSEEELISGAQFTMEFDADMLYFVGLESHINTLNDDNFGYTYVDEGVITFSWNTANAVKVQDMFTLEFIAKQDGNTSNAFNITSNITNAEAYDDNNEIMEVVFRSLEKTNGLVLYQNIPNPFNEQTTIAFNMPNRGDATFSVVDVAGKVLYSNTNIYEKGLNQLTLNKSQFNLSGVLYYQLTVGSETMVKKMVVIE